MVFLTRCDPISKHLLHEQLKRIVSIVNSYQWIIDAYVSDFYTKEFWNGLPRSYQAYFDAVKPNDLTWLLCCFDEMKNQSQTCYRQGSVLPPLSLLALRCCISSLALQRKPANIELQEFKETLLAALHRRDKHPDNAMNSKCLESEKEEHVSKYPQEETLTTEASCSPNFKNGQCMDMKHVFRKHVKPKKQHEINNLGQVVNLLSQITGSSAAVDVGAGLGHLARLLAFQHNLRVTTIEAAGSHAPKASEFDRDLRKNINKVKLKKKKKLSPSSHDFSHTSYCKSNCQEGSGHKRETEREDELHSKSTCHDVKNFNIADIGAKFEESTYQLGEKTETLTYCDTEMPHHVICQVQPDIAANQFLDIMLNRSQSDANYSREQKSADTNFVLVGLHACGDLTPTLLRVFLNCPTAQGLASVACCYMKMTASSSSSAHELDNFPMSSYLHDLQFPCLSYEAREMACHFADSYHQRLLDNPPHLKSHSYRAALEKLLRSVDSSFKSGQARITSKIGHGLTFHQYAEENLKKLGISIESVPESLMNKCAELTNDWMRVVAFYTLRLSLAPLVESLLLCDRALFLSENGVPSVLVPIFDPNISPRNFALLAVKP
ncbi:hypothetical protein RRG08_002289 [Elysia crispata]|uniref:Methyltransferase domain-containing protein n=1 Tax=Elysia crispata TaxID=231223 RepID=A0AAE1DD24_9GAST|nr:hypothetical protein RRG08_002289 [Elysia crispata]